MVWLIIVIKIIEGVKSCFGVIFNINLRLVLMKFECLVILIFNIVMSIILSGVKLVNVFIIDDKKVVNELFVSKLFIIMVLFVCGFIVLNVVFEKS